MKQLILISIFIIFTFFVNGQSLNNTKINGYRGIWFELNEKYDYGDKYSGGLGTYTAKHVPLAIYSAVADKTFFVFGGTPSEDKKHLLAMIGEFNHKTGMVSKPTVVYDKQGVKDPHDNPSVMIDDNGFIFVFVSGRGYSRPGIILKSKKPFDIDEFEIISEEEFTYPQPWNLKSGYLHFFTKYTGIRQLYFETSIDGINWTDDELLAAIPEKKGQKSGHYQISNTFKGKVVGTFFNRHSNGTADSRSDLYYVQSDDLGETWVTVSNKNLKLPILEMESSSRVVDYRSKGKNVYLKDMGFDSKGNPACLYIRSNGHEPGPESQPYEWCITKWDGTNWQTIVITTSDHNYDMGSLYISEENWKVVAPTIASPQKWAVGGELEIWISSDTGDNWKKEQTITQNSEFNNSYVRRPVSNKAPFCFFWASGDPNKFSKSELWFGDFEGNIWRLPYEMKNDCEKPIRK